MDVNIIKDERSERHKRYTRNKFKAWKERATGHLPNFVIAFYKAERGAKYIPYEKHVLLGRVIEGLNNPFHTLRNHDGTRTDAQTELLMEVILALEVNELFSYVKKISTI